MTILTVLFLTLVSTCLAQPADDNAKDRTSRAPPSQIQYSDPDGSKIDWKLYAPQNQWRSHLQSSQQRLQRAETQTVQANFSPNQQTPWMLQAPVHTEPHYKPFSSVPNHIKKLIVESYNHEGPYVDPGAFFYQAFAPIAVSSLASQPNQQQNDQTAHSQTHQLEREYFNSAVNYRASRYQDANDERSNVAAERQIGRVPPKAGIKYKDEERLTERSTSLPYGSVIGAQSREKIEYQPYKHISQSHFTQNNRQITDNQTPYSQYNKQVSQSQSNYPGKAPEISSQHEQYDKQTTQQHSRYNNQVSQTLQQYKKVESIKPVSETNYGNNMPMAIQQLLSYQAQLPYNVIANHIIYRPKQLFIPKPLPDSAKLSKQYPSKIYFLKNDGQIYDGPGEVIKDVKNEKRY